MAHKSSQDGKKNKSNPQIGATGQTTTSTTTKKKKVSSWLSSWRLPKLPRFRQRISSVLCLEAARKKQSVMGPTAESSSLPNSVDENLIQQIACDTNFRLNSPKRVSQICDISKALEDCLGVNSRIKLGRNPGLIEDHAPLFVTKWIDYSNKYGLAFQLSDKSVGVLFNDSTKMSYTQDRRYDFCFTLYFLKVDSAPSKK